MKGKYKIKKGECKMLKKITTKDKRTKLEKEIESVLEVLNGLDKSSEEYAKISENLERLYRSLGNEKPARISPDTKAVILANLAGLVLILNYEKAGHITSKALGFVIRGRV